MARIVDDDIKNQQLAQLQFIDLCIAAQKNNANINLILNSLDIAGVPNNFQESVIKYIQTTPENTNLSILLNVLGFPNKDAELLLQQYARWKKSPEPEIIMPSPDDDSSGGYVK